MFFIVRLAFRFGSSSFPFLSSSSVVSFSTAAAAAVVVVVAVLWCRWLAAVVTVLSSLDTSSDVVESDVSRAIWYQLSWNKQEVPLDPR